MTAWLHIVGIGEDGLEGLTAAAKAVVEAADVIVGGKRHHNLAQTTGAERLDWPSAFDTVPDLLVEHRNKNVVALVSGDPLWYSAGISLRKAFEPSELRFYPQVGAFQLAAARMGWPMSSTVTLTVHGRPVEQMIAFIQPMQKLLILTTGSETPGQIAAFLTKRGFGASQMTVLANMGGGEETQFTDTAADWSHNVPPFNTLAVDCVAAPQAALMPRVPGLADDLFSSDGTMTKREVRAATLSKLMPMRGALLWDIGTGCGSVAIDWLRSARYTRAIGLEPRADRRLMAAENALNLGVPELEILDGTAPEGLTGLDSPDAVFIGGGLSEQTFDRCWAALRPLGRLVCNAVTLESEALLIDLHARHGGDLVKLQFSRAEPIGSRTGWRPLMPVTQWSLVKR